MVIKNNPAAILLGKEKLDPEVQKNNKIILLKKDFTYSLKGYLCTYINISEKTVRDFKKRKYA